MILFVDLLYIVIWDTLFLPVAYDKTFQPARDLWIGWEGEEGHVRESRVDGRYGKHERNGVVNRPRLHRLSGLHFEKTRQGGLMQI